MEFKRNFLTFVFVVTFEIVLLIERCLDHNFRLKAYKIFVGYYLTLWIVWKIKMDEGSAQIQS